MKDCSLVDKLGESNFGRAISKSFFVLLDMLLDLYALTFTNVVLPRVSHDALSCLFCSNKPIIHRFIVPSVYLCPSETFCE